MTSFGASFGSLFFLLASTGDDTGDWFNILSKKSSESVRV
jgi:hypothetical protein